MFIIKTDSVVNFKRQLLVYLWGAIELYSMDDFSYQDIWSSIQLFYPKNKISDIDIDDDLNKIFGLISEIDTIKNDFFDIYPNALDQIRSLIKKNLEKYPTFERNGAGHLRWCITVDTH